MRPHSERILNWFGSGPDQPTLFHAEWNGCLPSLPPLCSQWILLKEEAERDYLQTHIVTMPSIWEHTHTWGWEAPGRLNHQLTLQIKTPYETQMEVIMRTHDVNRAPTLCLRGREGGAVGRPGMFPVWFVVSFCSLLMDGFIQAKIKSLFPPWSLLCARTEHTDQRVSDGSSLFNRVSIDSG